MTYKKTGKDTVTVFLAIGGKEGKQKCVAQGLQRGSVGLLFRPTPGIEKTRLFPYSIYGIQAMRSAAYKICAQNLETRIARR
jgi:hypothetical protein